jgi:predicted aspartyl protease
LDTGSYYSIISSKLAKKLNLKVEMFSNDEDKALYGANGSPMKLLGKAEITLDIQNLRIPQTIRVCDNLTENLILGRSFLEESSANINFNSKIVTFCDDAIQIPLQHLIDNRSVVRIMKPTLVPARSEIVVPVTCNRIFNNREVILKSIEGQQYSNFALANAIVTVINERTICRLMNFQDKPLVLSPGQRIGQLEMFDKKIMFSSY